MWIFHVKIGDIFRGGFYPLKKAGCQGRGRFLGSNIITSLGGGFKYCLFSSLFWEDSHFDEYFSNGLVQPPTRFRFGSDSF